MISISPPIGQHTFDWGINQCAGWIEQNELLLGSMARTSKRPNVCVNLLAVSIQPLVKSYLRWEPRDNVSQTGPTLTKAGTTRYHELNALHVLLRVQPSWLVFGLDHQRTVLNRDIVFEIDLESFWIVRVVVGGRPVREIQRRPGKLIYICIQRGGVGAMIG
jgi:hypothetical protein